MIKADRLSKRYGQTVALASLTVDLPVGGVTALVGPNGAGKSTFLRLCVGFERPSAGALEVFGLDPGRDRAGVIAKVGYVSQSPSLYRDMTISDHLRLVASLRSGFDTAHARARLADVEISPSARPRELSGGQQAQAALAIALGTRAPLLLLDEPLASLDPLARREFLEVVSAAVSSGDVSAIISSHVLTELEDTADHVLVLGSGNILFFDSVATSIRAHRTIEDDEDSGSGQLVGKFPGGRGAEFSLLATQDQVGRAPTLEEVVLGYLAADRGTEANGSFIADS